MGMKIDPAPIVRAAFSILYIAARCLRTFLCSETPPPGQESLRHLVFSIVALVHMVFHMYHPDVEKTSQWYGHHTSFCRRYAIHRKSL